LAWRGAAWLGEARHGAARQRRHGKARRGGARHGKARQDKARNRKESIMGCFRVNVSLPDELHAKLKLAKTFGYNPNISKIFQKALRDALSEFDEYLEWKNSNKARQST
jgi:hypothetical protein